MSILQLLVAAFTSEWIIIPNCHVLELVHRPFSQTVDFAANGTRLHSPLLHELRVWADASDHQLDSLHVAIDETNGLPRIAVFKTALGPRDSEVTWMRRRKIEVFG